MSKPDSANKNRQQKSTVFIIIVFIWILSIISNPIYCLIPSLFTWAVHSIGSTHLHVRRIPAQMNPQKSSTPATLLFSEFLSSIICGFSDPAVCGKIRISIVQIQPVGKPLRYNIKSFHLCYISMGFGASFKNPHALCIDSHFNFRICAFSHNIRIGPRRCWDTSYRFCFPLLRNHL